MICYRQWTPHHLAIGRLTLLLAMVMALAPLQASEASVPASGPMPPLPTSLPDGIPAFPGAWGGGMFATGGRGGKVIAVTNLNDHGQGSLRAAVETPGPRIVVFRVAGLIRLEDGKSIKIDNPDITIAGQTAPGDGICIANASVNINTRNVVIRHLRVRRGQPQGRAGDCISGDPEGQVIVDHCSTSWGMDENLSLYRYKKHLPNGQEVEIATRNITVQWCISSEALNPKDHAYGGTWGGEDSTFHHNLFACNTGRNPSIGWPGEFDYRNNVAFNWQHRTMDGEDETSLVNVINNYLKPGPATTPDMRNVIARMQLRSHYSSDRPWVLNHKYFKADRPGKWYVSGNIVEGSPEVTKNNWLGMRGPEELARVNTPFEGWPVAQQSAADAYQAVLAKAGATLPRRDAVDRRVIEMVRTGKVSTTTGIINDPKEVGAYPEYTFSPEAVPTDTDGDGMPDAWENAHGLSPNDAADGVTDADSDGYTNVEEFLNGTDPRERVDYRNLDNNVDTISG